MRQHDLTLTHSKPKRTRVGRGISAGGGKTAGRGTKGQKARTGANSNIPRNFDGGATSLVERLPKLKGFKSHRVKPVTVSLTTLALYFEDKAEISIISLLEKKIVSTREVEMGIKIVGASTPVTKTFTFKSDDDLLIQSKKLVA